ncbi:MAG: hypothetical protein KJ638_00095 [Chloroflexi bacterium]|nr:hypothetical protein [Chloroflexota bacterium]
MLPGTAEHLSSNVTQPTDERSVNDLQKPPNLRFQPTAFAARRYARRVKPTIALVNGASLAGVGGG